MVKSPRIAALWMMLAFIPILACSKNDPAPSSPPIFYQGRVSLENSSGVTIRLVGFAQMRGQTRVERELDVHLFTGQMYYFLNLIDPNQGHIFAGGDQITVRYVADEFDPDDPSQPLFQNSVQLTVNGSLVILVKGGGEYGISPG